MQELVKNVPYNLDIDTLLASFCVSDELYPEEIKKYRERAEKREKRDHGNNTVNMRVARWLARYGITKAEYSRKQREMKREQYREYGRKARQKSRDRINANVYAWRDRNREKYLAQRRAQGARYLERHRDEINARRRAQYAAKKAARAAQQQTENKDT